MNRKIKLKNFSPKELANYYTNNKIKYIFSGIPSKEFEFSIGDPVALKSSATKEGRKEKNTPGFKRSLGRYFYKNI